MVLFGKLDKFLFIFALVALCVIFVSAGTINTARPSHPITQISAGNENIVNDQNVILSKYGGTGLVSCSDGNVLVWSAAANSWKCGKNLMSLTDVNNIVVAASGGTGLVSCLDGNVLKWSGAKNKWVCGDNVSSGGGGGVVFSFSGTILWHVAVTSGGAYVTTCESVTGDGYCDNYATNNNPAMYCQNGKYLINYKTSSTRYSGGVIDYYTSYCVSQTGFGFSGGGGGGSGITGLGDVNKLTKWTGASSIGNSQIIDDGITVRAVGDICTNAGGGKCLSASGAGNVVGGGVDKRADGWNANCKPWGVAYCDIYQNLTCPVSTTRAPVGSTYVPINNRIPATWLATYICITN